MESACDCGNERSCNFCSLRQRSSMDPLRVYSRRRFRIESAADCVVSTTFMSSSTFGTPAASVGTPHSSTEASSGEENSDTSSSKEVDSSDTSSSEEVDSSDTSSSEEVDSSDTSSSEEQEGDIVVQSSEEDVPPNLSTRADATVVRSTGDAHAGSFLMLRNPGVLMCPRCDLPLDLPVFQCWNGHIACKLCCLKWMNKCFCGLTIGFNRCLAMEKVIEAIRSSCRYVDYGCPATFTYTERRVHESNCDFKPFCCPSDACEYISKCKELYDHFYLQHRPREFVFNTTFSLDIPRDEYMTFFQERDEKALFILESTACIGGTSVVLYGLAPSSMHGVFKFKICTACGSMIASDFVRVFRGKLPNAFAMLRAGFIPEEYRTVVLDLNITICKEQGLLGLGSS